MSTAYHASYWAHALTLSSLYVEGRINDTDVDAIATEHAAQEAQMRTVFETVYRMAAEKRLLLQTHAPPSGKS